MLRYTWHRMRRRWPKGGPACCAATHPRTHAPTHAHAVADNFERQPVGGKEKKGWLSVMDDVCNLRSPVQHCSTDARQCSDLAEVNKINRTCKCNLQHAAHSKIHHVLSCELFSNQKKKTKKRHSGGWDFRVLGRTSPCTCSRHMQHDCRTCAWDAWITS